VTGRWRSPLALVAIVFATSCAAQSGVGGGSAQGTPGAGASAPVPFASFLAGVSAASYQDYAGKPETRVRDSAAFRQMREFLLTKYQGTRVARTFTDSGGGVFDCVQLAGGTASAPPSAATPPGTGTGSGAGSGTGAPGTRSGSAGPCPDGSVPTRRITLIDLVRFPTLQDYFGKAPGGGQLPMPPSPSTSG